MYDFSPLQITQGIRKHPSREKGGGENAKPKIKKTVKLNSSSAGFIFKRRFAHNTLSKNIKLQNRFHEFLRKWTMIYKAAFLVWLYPACKYIEAQTILWLPYIGLVEIFSPHIIFFLENINPPSHYPTLPPLQSHKSSFKKFCIGDWLWI